MNVEVVPARDASSAFRREVLHLCNEAYEEDVEEFFELIEPDAHVVVREAGSLVSHAMWVTRWLQAGEAPPLPTAYVEFVATAPRAQGRGLARAVMERTVEEARRTFPMAALCPAVPEFYRRLGWRSWEGPLAVRTESGGLIDTPEEKVMVLPLRADVVPDVTLPLTVEWRPGEMW